MMAEQRQQAAGSKRDDWSKGSHPELQARSREKTRNSVFTHTEPTSGDILPSNKATTPSQTAPLTGDHMSQGPRLWGLFHPNYHSKYKVLTACSSQNQQDTYVLRLAVCHPCRWAGVHAGQGVCPQVRADL